MQDSEAVLKRAVEVGLVPRAMAERLEVREGVRGRGLFVRSGTRRVEAGELLLEIPIRFALDPSRDESADWQSFRRQRMEPFFDAQGLVRKVESLFGDDLGMTMNFVFAIYLLYVRSHRSAQLPHVHFALDCVPSRAALSFHPACWSVAQRAAAARVMKLRSEVLHLPDTSVVFDYLLNAEQVFSDLFQACFPTDTGTPSRCRWRSQQLVVLTVTIRAHMHRRCRSPGCSE
jgi:hypothetical protein